MLSPHRLDGRLEDRRVCSICHVPKRNPALDAVVPRWNAATAQLVFAPFDEPSDEVPPRPLQVARDGTHRCLSCHDAAIGDDIPDGRVARVLVDVARARARGRRGLEAGQIAQCPSPVGAAMERHVRQSVAAGPAPAGRGWEGRQRVGSVRVPTSISKLCLSCHDGTMGANALGAARVVRTTGRGDHPVAVRYDDAARSGLALRDPAMDSDGDPDTIGDEMPYLPLYHGRLECTTCHHPHDNASAGNPKLLIRGVERSALCRTCHEE